MASRACTGCGCATASAAIDGRTGHHRDQGERRDRPRGCRRRRLRRDGRAAARALAESAALRAAGGQAEQSPSTNGPRAMAHERLFGDQGRARSFEPGGGVRSRAARRARPRARTRHGPYAEQRRLFRVPARCARGRHSTIPGGRGTQPEEIAEGIRFLLSDGAGFVNEIRLDVDGGKAAQLYILG